MARLRGLAALVALGVGSCACVASAQEMPTDDKPASSGITPNDKPMILSRKEADAPDKPVSWQPLAAWGIGIALNYTGEAAANPVGGLRQRAAYAGQLYMGLDFDLARIADIPGGVIHVAVTNRHGENLAETAIGNNTSVQEIWGTQNTHLAILTWEQVLFDGKLDLEAGKSQANIHFLTSPLYCNFQSNSACGNPTFIFKDSNFTYFPASSWMARAKLTLDDRWFVHSGIYEVSPNRKRPDDNGFSASFEGDTGFIVPYELGYGTDFKTDRLPRHYILGGWVDQGDYADPLSDNQGGVAILTGQPSATRNGRSGIYFRFDQMLTRPDPHSERGLSIFGVAMTNLTGRVEEANFWELGLVQTGTFPGRDKDTLGFVFNDQHFSDLAIERMNAARIAVGGKPDVRSHQFMMELAYGLQLTEAVRLSPNVQYILHPDQSGEPSRPTAIRNALVFGLKFTVDATKLNVW